MLPNSRRAFLMMKKQSGMPLTGSEKNELASLPEIVGERDANGNFVAGCMVVPGRAASMEAFARQYLNMDDTPATDDQIGSVICGSPIVITSRVTPPVETLDVEPRATDDGTPGDGMPVDDATVPPPMPTPPAVDDLPKSMTDENERQRQDRERICRDSAPYTPSRV